MQIYHILERLGDTCGNYTIEHLTYIATNKSISEIEEWCEITYHESGIFHSYIITELDIKCI